MSAAAITIRMYNVGFGDCFLVKIPNNGGTLKILFDCGSIKAGPRPMAEVVKDVVKEVTEPDGKARIDVVVATHRHKDHVSGFANALWKSVEVKEVWLPWTEDPNNPEARKIRDTQSKLAALLTSNTEKARAQLTAASPPALAARLEAMADIALNALTNEVEMQTLHEGFLGKPLRRFLPTDKRLAMSHLLTLLQGATHQAVRQASASAVGYRHRRIGRALQLYRERKKFSRSCLSLGDSSLKFAITVLASEPSLA